MEEKVPTINGARDMDKIVEGKKVKVVGTWRKATPESHATLTVRDPAGEINFIWSDSNVQPNDVQSNTDTPIPKCWEMMIISEMVKIKGYYTVSFVSAGPIPEPERSKHWGKRAKKINRGERSPVHHT